MTELLKDDKLAFMIEKLGCNTAKFISITPNKKIKHIYIDKNYTYNGDLKKCILDLITSSNSKSINIRSFSLTSMKGHSLVYGKKKDDIDEIIRIIQENCELNKYSIINETIDINDGGVSGVVLGNIIEFAPNDTPKCVEKPQVCFLEKNMGISILKTVYGFPLKLNFEDQYRVEFSIHPKREGLCNDHTVIWEFEEVTQVKYDTKIKWPNKFSKFIGDKTFGLLIADYLGFNVPHTTVISRNIAPFSFGKETGIKEKWIRTSPIIKEPGKYYTGDRWIDPFILMEKEEIKGSNHVNIAAILSQSAVEPVYSGAAIINQDKINDVIEGVPGKGDNFMVGLHKNHDLPVDLVFKLEVLLDDIRKYHSILGNVSIEWVYDGIYIWIVQLNQVESISTGPIIVSGTPTKYKQFFIEDGLEKLRYLIDEIKDKNIGIELIGDVGICSHFGDVLRQANIPSYITKDAKHM